ncbi:myosin light chain kinase, smooth muscle-like protein, partial [Lates japonicus]
MSLLWVFSSLGRRRRREEEAAEWDSAGARGFATVVSESAVAGGSQARQRRTARGENSSSRWQSRAGEERAPPPLLATTATKWLRQPGKTLPTFAPSSLQQKPAGPREWEAEGGEQLCGWKVNEKKWRRRKAQVCGGWRHGGGQLGSEAWLQCRARLSLQARKIKYLGAGGRSSNRQLLVLASEGGLCSLTIDKALPEDEGLYKCRAETSAGKAECSCTVLVD